MASESVEADGAPDGPPDRPSTEQGDVVQVPCGVKPVSPPPVEATGAEVPVSEGEADFGDMVQNASDLVSALVSELEKCCETSAKDQPATPVDDHAPSEAEDTVVVEDVGESTGSDALPENLELERLCVVTTTASSDCIQTLGQPLDEPLTESELQERLDELWQATNLQTVRNFDSESLIQPQRKRPVPPIFGATASPFFRMRQIQKFVESFEYNYTGENFFDIKGVRENQTLTRVLDIARRVVSEALPIKCVEAVYLGIHLTQSMNDIVRVPLIFYSSINGHRYGHIVLAVRVEGRFGALGLSRRNNLMYKEPKFDTMYDLIRDYRESYREWGHSLAKVKLGPALPHAGDSRASQPIEWSKLVLSVKGKKFARCEGAISKFMRELLRFIPVAPAQTAIKGRWNTVNVIAQLKKQRPPSESAADKSKDDKRRKRRKGKKAGKSEKGGDTVERDDTAGGDSSECSAAHTKDLSEEREGQRSSAVCKSRGSERSRSRSQSFSVPEDEGDTDAAHDSVLSPGGAEAPIARPTFLGV